ncbi:MAG: hypothetical protein ACM33U_00285 [Solirubrobacterales bacterium]|nr:hypothetical protein [Solirubrobacterales bacterium]
MRGPVGGPPPSAQTMLIFFSSRSGCLRSLLISAIGTIILLFLTGVIRLS